MEANNSMPSMVLVQGWPFFRESAAAPELAGRYKPLANCLRSGGLPLDQGVSLNCESGIKKD